jgi:tRNA-uridine 2-sulfurtransferase
VVDYMIREYSEGRVPNPDVMCNKHVKFGAFLDFAKKNGADFIATGHYARVAHVQEQPFCKLLVGVDKEKDQSYFLWTLTQAQLAHTLFPVGHLQKSEVRTLAKEFGLPNAEKKDSQGLCFMGVVDMADFLKHYLKTKEGVVHDAAGNAIGTHDGAILYTIGQRHGFRTTKSHTDESPLFVVEKDVAHNTITVAPRMVESAKQNSASCTIKEVDDVLLLALSKHATLRCVARIRYRGSLYPAIITQEGSGRIGVSMTATDAYVTQGQSIVFYDGEQCLGGGVIA